MAPKKSTGFMTFVNEWRGSCNEGRKMTIAEAVNRCGDLWKDMDQQQRGPYLSRAKNADVAQSANRERLNCQGQAVTAVEREEREAVNEVVKMKRNIERMVIDGKKQHDLENTKFIFAAFNFFTKAINSDVYVPAEFSACEYSLKSGMSSIYSSHINPGSCIFGQGREALHHTSTTHQLPLPPQALGESNMGRLYNHIVEYLRPIVGQKNPLVVFTPTSMVPIVRACFRYLECGLEEQESENIFVYDIQYLFYVLKKEVLDIAAIEDSKVNNYVTDSIFLKDFFEYQMDISCQFHEDNDRGKYCTQSMVTRWCYTFSDYMCGDLAIAMVPGSHSPPITKPNFHVTYEPNESTIGRKDESMSSYYSGVSRLKTEDSANTSMASSLASRYVPTDHTAFNANIRAPADFPCLGARKAKKRPESIPQEQEHRVNAVPEHLMSAWQLPRKHRIEPMVDDDDFIILAGPKKNSVRPA